MNALTVICATVTVDGVGKHIGIRRKPFSWERGGNGGGPPRTPTIPRIEDSVGTPKNSSFPMNPFMAFTNGGEKLHMNEQWRKAIGKSDAALIHANAMLRAEMANATTDNVRALGLCKLLSTVTYVSLV